MQQPQNALVESPKFSTFLSSNAGTKLLESALTNPKKRESFITASIAYTSAMPELSKCRPDTLVSAFLQIQAIGFPVIPSLGLAFVIPYEMNRGKANAYHAAQFQMGAAGYYQLGLWSGQYKEIKYASIKDAEFQGWDRINEKLYLNNIWQEYSDIEIDKMPTVGYWASFTTTTGLHKEIYWSKEKMEIHAQKYSIMYKRGYSSSWWIKDFDVMGEKTIIKRLMKKWGPLSNNNLTDAIIKDESVIVGNKFAYIDSPESEESLDIIEGETEADGI